MIQVPGTEQSIALRDLLGVRPWFEDPPADLAYFNGERAIVVSVSITLGVNAVDFGERLTAKIRDLESRLPSAMSSSTRPFSRTWSKPPSTVRSITFTKRW